MIKINSNIINISLLKCCVDELNNLYEREIPCSKDETKVFDITETIQEVIERLGISMSRTTWERLAARTGWSARNLMVLLKTKMCKLGPKHCV